MICKHTKANRQKAYTLPTDCSNKKNNHNEAHIRKGTLLSIIITTNA